MLYSAGMKAFGLALVMLVVCGCSSTLPSASHIDKLRVLAVKAEPPEVAPGAPSSLSALVVEPLLPQLDASVANPTVSYLWLACAIPPGASEEAPCGLGPSSQVATDATPTSLPLCKDQPGASLCEIGTEQNVSYTPSASAVGKGETTQLLITLVVADNQSAFGCLIDAATSGNQQPHPDHCVVALKRLVVTAPDYALADGTKPAPNHNPLLTDLSLVEDTDLGVAAALDADGGAFDVAPVKDAPTFELRASRAADAAEQEPRFDESSGKLLGTQYEALTVAWFATGGKIDGGRSLFVPDGKDSGGHPCATQSDCPTTQPITVVTTKWTAPDPEMLSATAPGGEVRLWAVLRDDRGGVSWLQGSARAK
jgi:hypothetical protein